MRYARKCDFCSMGMDQGYVCHDGYFCSDSCRDISRDLRGYNEFNDIQCDVDYDVELSKVVVYDNQGESIDRYTVFAPDGNVFAMSEFGDLFNNYVGDDTDIKQGSHLGILLDSVPKGIRYAVLGRIIKDDDDDSDDYFTMWDESFFDDSFYYQVEFKYNMVNRTLCFHVEDPSLTFNLKETTADGIECDIFWDGLNEIVSINVAGMDVILETINN